MSDDSIEQDLFEWGMTAEIGIPDLLSAPSIIGAFCHGQSRALRAEKRDDMIKKRSLRSLFPAIRTSTARGVRIYSVHVI